MLVVSQEAEEVVTLVYTLFRVPLCIPMRDPPSAFLPPPRRSSRKLLLHESLRLPSARLPRMQRSCASVRLVPDGAAVPPSRSHSSASRAHSTGYFIQDASTGAKSTGACSDDWPEQGTNAASGRDLQRKRHRADLKDVGLVSKR